MKKINKPATINSKIWNTKFWEGATMTDEQIKAFNRAGILAIIGLTVVTTGIAIGVDVALTKATEKVIDAAWNAYDEHKKLKEDAEKWREIPDRFKRDTDDKEV